MHRSLLVTFIVLMCTTPLFMAGCDAAYSGGAVGANDPANAQSGANEREKNNLAAMSVVNIEIVGRTTYRAFVAADDASRQLGLMNVSEHELAPDEGMIFVFYTDRPRSFWMRNTIIPLDIAYIRSDGLIVKTYTMEPLYEGGYPSIEAAKYALEVHAGQFDKWGIREGDRVVIPAQIAD